MGNIKKLLLILFMFSCSVQAAQIKYDLGGIHIGYADWDSGVEDANRGNLMKLVLDYGMILDKGELMVIYEQNHFEKNVDKRNYTYGGLWRLRPLPTI